MKQILLASLFILGLAQMGSAQLTRVVVERSTDGSTNLCGASVQPEATTTYRVFAELEDADDFLSAIAAVEGCYPLNISTTTTFYNSPIGGALGNDLNTALCGAFPEGGFDSFITIGQETSSDAGLTQAAFTNPTAPFSGSFEDTDGTSFEIYDGTIFTLNGNTNGIPVGPNNRVFLGQFTTDGDFSFDINLQVFDGGDGSQNLFYVASGELDCIYDPANPFPNMPTVIDGSEIGLIYDSVNDCAPVNDLCSGAINIDDQVNQGPFTVDNSCATVSGIFDNDCFEDGCNDLWYSFTYNGGTITVETILNDPDYSCDGGTGYLGDSRIAVFQDCDGALVDCNDDNQDLESLIALDASSLTLGETYYVQVGGYSSVAAQDGCIEDALGVFEVQISNCSVMNDECTGAINIDHQVNQGPFTVDNSCATVSGIFDNDCFEDGCNDLWYSFTYNGGTVIVETILNDPDYSCDEGSGYLGDSRIAVFQDCDGALVDCNDDNQDLESLIALDASSLTLGETYYVQVGGYSSVADQDGCIEDALGIFEVQISNCSVINDECTGAINIDDQVNQGPFTVNNSCATVSGIVDGDCFEDGCNDLWYSFIYFGGELTIETILSGTLWDSRLAVYSDCSGTLVACNDDNEDLESLIDLDGDDLIIGNSYYLQVGGYSSGNNSGGDAYGTFEVEISLDGVLGCTDESALNYNAEANVDNETCVYQELDINDTPSTAEPLTLDIAAGPGSSCNGYSGENLNGASASTQESITSSLFDELPGLWYSFVPYSSGNQITVETEDFDAVIEVFDTNLLQLEGVDGMEANANEGAGDEIFQIGNLTAGNTYYVRVTSTTEISEAANFDICIQTFRDTRCDYLPGTYSLCQMYKADYVFADAYQFHFTSQTTGITYSSDAQISTFLVLRNVEGLPFGDVYDVAIEAIYYMPDGAGTIQTVVVANDEPCEISIIDAPVIKMRSQDNNMNHGPHYPGNFIRTNTYACSAIAYTWKFTRTDVQELPQEYTTATSSTLVRISDVLGNGVAPGSVYDVQVKPIFANGQEAEYGEVESISIIGAAGIIGDVVVANEISEDAQRDETLIAPESMVYPNPTTGLVNIAMSNLEEEQVLAVSVTDFLGRTVSQSTQVAKEGSVLMNMDLNALAAGTYLIHITAGEHVQTEKLMIVK